MNAVANAPADDNRRVESAPAPCPICGKPRSPRYRPFCSKRCADVDLHRWLGGGYVIAAREEDDAPEDKGAPPEESERE